MQRGTERSRIHHYNTYTQDTHVTHTRQLTYLGTFLEPLRSAPVTNHERILPSVTMSLHINSWSNVYKAQFRSRHICPLIQILWSLSHTIYIITYIFTVYVYGHRIKKNHHVFSSSKFFESLYPFFFLVEKEEIQDRHERF